MPASVPDTWNIVGNVVAVDGVTPFFEGTVTAFDVYNGVETSLNGSGLDNSGNFSIIFSKGQFQSVDPGRTAPDIILRVYDFQGRLLRQSDMFTPLHASSSVNLVLDRMPVPNVWNVYGTAFGQDGATPFTQGLIYIYNKKADGSENELAHTGFNWDGHFTLTFSRDMFQLGNVDILAPNAVFKIFDYQSNLLWQYGPVTLPSSEYYINPLVDGSGGSAIVPDIPDVPEDWLVTGKIINSNSLPLDSVAVKVYDLLLDQEILLGTVHTNHSGDYHFEYAKSAFQGGCPGRLAPNLFIRVFSSDGGDLIFESEVHLDALPHTVIDVALVARNWVVSGTVRDSSGFLVTVGTIRVYDIYNLVPFELGRINLDHGGQYAVHFSCDDFQRGNQFRSAPNLQVRLQYPLDFLLVESEVLVDVSPVHVVDLVVSLTTPDFDYCVFGHVSNDAHLPVAHHVVEAYALQIGGGKFVEVFLGRGLTCVEGNYEISYDPLNLECSIDDDPADHGFGTVSLFIKLPQPRGPYDPTVYDTSPAVCHSARCQRIDIQVNRHSGSSISEYQLVESALSAYFTVLKDVFFHDYEPGFSNRIRYLSCRTGVDEDKVSCYYYSLHFSRWVNEALCGSVAVRTDCDFDKFMYATFRAGYSWDIPTLCASDATGYYRALVDAVNDMIIPESVTATLPFFWENWLEIVRFLTSATETVGVLASAGTFAATVLEIARGDEPSTYHPDRGAWDQQRAEDEMTIRRVVEIHQQVQGDMLSFWEVMWDNAGKEERPDRYFSDLFVTQLAFIHDLYAIAGGFFAFAQGAYKYFAVTKISEYQPPISAFQIRELASVDEDEWVLMTSNFLDFTDGEYPLELVGSTDEEKLQILAVTTMELYRSRFPLENAAEVFIESGSDELQAIGVFLKGAANFDLDTVNIDEYDFGVHDVDIDVLKALQRINRLTEDAEAQIYLIEEHNLDSSYKISVIDEEVFVADHAEALGGIEEARQIHRLAAMYASETLSLLGRFHDSLNFEGHSMPAVNRGVPFQGFSSSFAPLSQTSSASAAAMETTPSYENLFGALTQVQFENTQSIFGASAYFVELLEFVDGLNRKNIFSRRPELREIELTDANAGTVLPYIDIVLEMLENAVAPRQFFMPDPGNAIETFLSGGSSVIPENLKERLREHAVEVPDAFEVVQQGDGSFGYYFLIGSWRVCFSGRQAVAVSANTYVGYLVTAFPQTTKSVADLAVVPEHRNPQTYKALSKLYFPLQLPLNPGADEVQETMKLLGVSKPDSILAFRLDRGNRYNNVDDGSEFESWFICANLGISQSTKELLESYDGGEFRHCSWELWGLQQSGNDIPAGSHGVGSSWDSVLSYVPEFMHRTGLTVDGMLDLFALKTFDGITLDAFGKGLETGDPNFFMISGFSAGNLVQIHLHLRLRSILQCSWKDLDSFLRSAYHDNSGLVDKLNRVHVARLFMARYPSVTLPDIGCFWGPAVSDTNNRLGKSPFEERFVSGRLNDDATSLMSGLTGTQPFAEDLGSIDDARQALQQVLRLSEVDLDTIIRNEFDPADSAGIFLNLANVSRVLRVSLLAGALRLGINDFYALKELTGLEPFDNDRPEALLYFDDECRRLFGRGLAPSAVKRFLTESPPAVGDITWVQGSVRSLREIVKETETFLASDAVPFFGENISEEIKFKKNYREENTLERVKNDVAGSFMEFTGGDFELAVRMLDVKEPRKKSMYELWSRLGDVGWSRSLNTGTTTRKSTVDNFSLPEDLGDMTGAEVKWSSVFIVPQGHPSIGFKVHLCDCAVTLKIGEFPLKVFSSHDETVFFKIPAEQFTAGEAVQIEITASGFTNSGRYYLDLEWDVVPDENLGEGTEPRFAKIPLWALIPKASWTKYEKLASVLPEFRKMSEYLRLTGMTPDFFKVLTGKGGAWQILQPKELPVNLNDGTNLYREKFTRLLDVQNVYAGFPINRSRLVLEDGADLFWTMVEALESHDDAQRALEYLSNIQGRWSSVRLVDMVNEAMARSGFELDNQPSERIANPGMLAFILESMPVVERVGVPVSFLGSVQEPSPGDVSVINFRGALQQRLGISSWSNMVTSMMNAMRIRRRDAIVAFLTRVGPHLNQSQSVSSATYFDYLKQVLYNAGVLISSGGELVLDDEELPGNVKIYESLQLYSMLTGVSALLPDASNWSVTPDHWSILDGRKGYRTDNDLYANFLIDVKMNTEMITSRIVQASAAIQLFVQRVLLGLEPRAHLDESNIERWALLKNYRMWEACRKIFLYPENWIEPEFRDDKTSFFEEFEAELEGGEITSDTAKKALGNFLRKFRTVAGLDIVGIYQGESEIPRGKDTLHVIGKTKALPYRYYYRRCHRKSNLANVWTPWEAIGVDVHGGAVLPVMFNGILHLFWAQFKPANNPGEPEIIEFIDGSQGGSGTGKLENPTNTAVVELSLFWSSLVEGRWTEKKQTVSFVDRKNEFYTNQDPTANVADRYHFRVGYIDNEQIQIEVYTSYTSYEEDGRIHRAGAYRIYHDGDNIFEKGNDEAGRYFFPDPQGAILMENHTVSFNSRAVIRSDGTGLLGRTSSGYKLLVANSGFLDTTQFKDEPGFLIENSRTWFLERSDNRKSAPTYKMEALSHPIIKEFQKRFDEGGLSSLMRRETQALSMATGSYYGYGYSYYRHNYYYNVLLGYYTAGDWQAWDAGQNAFELRYLPNPSLSRPYPMDVVDFNYGTPNGIYNWELFFYAPFFVARQLSANQRYEEALEWFHLIFDPRNKRSGYEKTKRWALGLPQGAHFWNFLPFFANTDAAKTIEELMGLPNHRSAMPDNVALNTLVDDWKDDPFNPHLIARSRIVAYQKAVIMSYLDTLVAWADQLFRQDTLESINEAIQLYILAAEVLGQRPQTVPSTLGVKPLSYTQMKAKNMDAFSNVVVQLENSLVKAVDDAKSTGQGSINQSTKQALGLAPRMYFFTVPRNERMMAYWDLLDDRLFKIRNGMNIEGVRRQLSLFAPPIDPGMLVRAAAAGIDIGAALSDMFAPIPKYRFTFMVQKAVELCGIVQSMGGAVLSALEKKDAEEMARLRAEHESILLRLSKEIRLMQIEEAAVTIESLEKTKAAAEHRRDHYQGLVDGRKSDLELAQLALMGAAGVSTVTSQAIRIGGSAAAVMPDINVGVSGFGGTPQITTIVSPRETGKGLAGILAGAFDIATSALQTSASIAGIEAGYKRREQDWKFQVSAAKKELEGIDVQILGAQIRRQVAEKELGTLEKQIVQSEEIYEYLKNKYTNKELYTWMLSEVSTLYSRSYQLAYDVAKRAEKSYEFELGITGSSFIRFGYWDNLRSGLFAGERLMLDLRRMEMSYIEKNSRELEITKPVSIAQLDPRAILDLQETGKCSFSLPEALFDLDFPGHYFRRIRSVRLTVPCVAGPYTSVSAKLTLTQNSMRKSNQANPADGASYGYIESGDPRFVHQRVGIQGIATSQPSDTAGVFDFNFRDERYLPFEGAGVISEWSLELPENLRQFDYRNIRDIVLHISYTAREDGGLKEAAKQWLKSYTDKFVEALSANEGKTLNRLVSLKHDFKDVYNNLLESGRAEFKVTREHFPYFFRNMDLVVASGSGVLALSKNTDLTTRLITISFDGTPVGAGTSFIGPTGETQIYEAPIEYEGTALVTCSIETELGESEVDDVLLSLNYSIN